MNEVIRELASTNPDATPAELSNTLIREIELAIPRAIRRLKPPRPVSPAKAKLAQLKLRRMKATRRSATEKELSAQERFQASLYRLQHPPNGHAVSGASTVTTQLWDTTPFKAPDVSEYDGQPFLTETVLHLERQDLDDRILPAPVRPQPYAAVRQKDSSTRVRRFMLHEDFVKSLGDHTMLWRATKSVEEAAREFAEQTGTDWDFQLLAESDIEIPSWKRFILSLSTPVADLDEKVRYWDLLDGVMRQRVAELAQKFPDHGEEISRFGKSLYLRMDLS